VESNVNALKRSAAELSKLAEEQSDDEQLLQVIRLDMDKIGSALEYYDWLNRLIDALENGDIYTLVPKKESGKLRNSRTSRSQPRFGTFCRFQSIIAVNCHF
jgi:hypothetical protein